MTRPFINYYFYHVQYIDTIYSVVCKDGCEIFKVIHHRFGLIRALGYGVRQLSDVRFVFYTGLLISHVRQ